MSRQRYHTGRTGQLSGRSSGRPGQLSGRSSGRPGWSSGQLSGQSSGQLSGRSSGQRSGQVTGQAWSMVLPLNSPDLEVTGESALSSRIQMYQTNNELNMVKVANKRRDSDYDSIGGSLPPVCVTCHCQRHDDTSSRVTKAYSDTDTDSDDDSDDDCAGDSDDSLRVEHMLRMLEESMTSGAGTSQVKNVIQFLNNHSISDDITQQQVTQILLRRTKPELRESVLLLIGKLCSHDKNAIAMAKMEILNDLLSVLSSPHSVKIHMAVLRALEQLFSHARVAGQLAEAVGEVLLPVVLRILYSDHPVEMKYTACCVLRALSPHKTTASLVGQELLFLVKELKKSSSKIKEVFVEIVINLYSQTGVVDPDVIDTSILTATTAMIVDGPCGVQCRALHLVCCLVENEAQVTDVLTHPHLFVHVLQCMRDSYCTRVREGASKVVRALCGYRKSSLARSVMDILTAFLNPHQQPDLLNNGDASARTSARIVYPVLARHQAEMLSWQSFSHFLSLIARLITREATVQEYQSSTSELNSHQLGCLAALVSIATHLCQWPLDRSKSSTKIDVSDIIDDDNFRTKAKCVNRQITSEVWTRCGKPITAVLSKFAEKVQTQHRPPSAGTSFRHSYLSSPLSARRNKTPRGDILNASEIHLVKSLLEFFLCVSVASCASKRSNTSRSSSDIMSKRSNTSRSTSDSVEPRNKPGLWVVENPHLTSSIGRSSASESGQLTDRKQRLELEREASADRRLLRRALYEEDLFRVVSPFVTFQNQDVRMLSTLVLRCSIQPLEENVEAPDKHVLCGSSSGPVVIFKPRLRPESAKTHREREKKMAIALHQMAPEVAGVIKSAFRQRPSSASSLNNYSQRRRQTSRVDNSRPVMDLTQPIAQQCRKGTVDNCGLQLIKGLFSKERDVKKSCLLLIRDLVNHGNMETHMQLSQIGLIPQLVDFLRLNEDDEILEIIAIILTRMLLSRNQRLKQVFNRHGGSSMLLSLTHTSSGALQEEVKVTLKSLTQGVSQRPSSAPCRRSNQTRESDIWDSIMCRWQEEDRVMNILHKSK